MKKSNHQLPFFSIVTVSFNSEKFIRDCIESVVSQDCSCFEYIIIDGGSSDSTIDIINEYRDKIDVLISEPDGGIYDAFNKGLRLCRGQVIKLVNSDDILPAGALKYVQKKLSNCNIEINPILLIGKTNVVNDLSEVISVISDKQIIPGFESFNHPSWFLSRLAFEAIGYYNTSYKIAGDYDYYLRAKECSVRVIRADRILAVYRKGGASSRGITGPIEVLRINVSHNRAILGLSIFIQHISLRLISILLHKSRLDG